MSRLDTQIEEINRIENAADELLHSSLSQLFTGVKTVEKLTNAVKWRENLWLSGGSNGCRRGCR